MSHQIPAESEVSRQSRATPPPPPQIKVSHLLRTPPSHFPVSLAAGRGPGGGRGVAVGWWRVSWHFWVPKTDRATGGCPSYDHTSRATLCNSDPWLPQWPQISRTCFEVLETSFRTNAQTPENMHQLPENMH